MVTRATLAREKVQDAAAQEGWTRVYFKRNYGRWYAGDRAGFPDAEARQLIALGVAWPVVGEGKAGVPVDPTPVAEPVAEPVIDLTAPGIASSTIADVPAEPVQFPAAIVDDLGYARESEPLVADEQKEQEP